MTDPVYLDHHATSRCDPFAIEAMLPYFGAAFGNASSRTHTAGIGARQAAERARGQIAQLIGASPKEIVFTSGATEANNLALLGAARARQSSGRTHVITVVTEHPAVLDPCRALSAAGFEVTILPVDADGLVDVAAFAAALRETTAIASVMRVNNEIGVIQPIEELAALAHEAGAWFHTDAAQAAFVPTDVHTLGVDLMSLSAHKMHGPMGVGALFVRRARTAASRIMLEPLQYGGGHERSMRSGTLPVPLVVGFAAAADRLLAERPAELVRIEALRDRLCEGLIAGLPGVTVNGSLLKRAPNNLNICIGGVEAAALVMGVRRVLAISTGSACASEDARPSPVLRALGLSAEAVQTAIRFGLGRFTTAAEVDEAVFAVVQAATQLRGQFEEEVQRPGS